MMVMEHSDVVGMRNPALYCRIFCFVHCHGLLFVYEFLHYIAGFFSLFPLFWNPENSGFFLFSIALGWFCLSVIGCFPYFFLVFSGSLCYSIYNNVYRILYPDLKLKKMHCLTHCLTTYFNQSVKKSQKKSERDTCRTGKSAYLCNRFREGKTLETVTCWSRVQVSEWLQLAAPSILPYTV